jgi:hypothetical protein
MKSNIIFTAAVLLIAIANPAYAETCLQDGQKVTLQGKASLMNLNMANGSTSRIYILETYHTICVNQLLGDSIVKGEIKKFQIIGSPPPKNILIELVGVLSTGNVTQYYGVPNAIKILSGRKILSSEILIENRDTEHQKTILSAENTSSKINNSFLYCIVPKIQYGQYSSYDGGKSAGALLWKDCPMETQNWIADCVQLSKTNDKECSLRAGVVTQIILKQFGK